MLQLGLMQSTIGVVTGSTTLEGNGHLDRKTVDLEVISATCVGDYYDVILLFPGKEDK